MFTFHNYWNYFRDDYDWPDNFIRPDIARTRQIFEQAGIPPEEHDTLIESGYVNVMGDTIIDRYYGGPLMSIDSITRFDMGTFKMWYEATKSRTPMFRKPPLVTSATSIDDLEQQIKDLRDKLKGRELLFRGQTTHYQTTRKIPNPNFVLDGLGEVSLIPSIWRTLLQKKPNSYHCFEGLIWPEWMKIIESQFDLQEIDRRIKKRIDQGEWLASAQDLEDSDDPLLSTYGRIKLDLSMGSPINLPDLLNTLLQHYGLPTPYLDLSSDLRIALFFASHKYRSPASGPEYQFVGSNEGKSILYIFKHDRHEMPEYAHGRVLHNLEPLRPKNQSCVICRSSSLAINLAGLYLVHAIRIDFELPLAERMLTRELFPSSTEDKFLAALLANCRFPDRIQNFRYPVA